MKTTTNIKMATPIDLKPYIQLNRWLANPVMQQAFKESCLALCQSVGLDEIPPARDWRKEPMPQQTGNLTPNSFTFLTIQSTSRSYYELITTHPEGSLADPETLRLNLGKKVSYPEYEIDTQIRLYLSCPLPAEDYETLKSLGKIKTTYQPGYSSSTVACDIPNADCPF